MKFQTFAQHMMHCGLKAVKLFTLFCGLLMKVCLMAYIVCGDPDSGSAGRAHPSLHIARCFELLHPFKACFYERDGEFTVSCSELLFNVCG
jgi:hypothetical protein